MKRKITWSIVVLLIVLGWWYRSLIYYGYVQAKGQLHIVYSARPVEDYLADSSTPDSIKYKLRLVQKIRKFATDSLGILPSDNYTKMYDQQEKPLMWVVTGCQPFAMEEYTWQFPVVGEFPYKGFFDSDMANEELERVKQLGYDVGIRNPSGWSTLGWFEDPILSNMLLRNEGQLAELIIHELTHFTIFVKDSVDFNENLASFVGEKGAISFLMHEFGEKSEQLSQYMQEEYDYAQYVHHFIRGAKALDSLYFSFNADTSHPDKQHKKTILIDSIIKSIDTIGLYNSHRYRQHLDTLEINNTYFMSYLRYKGEQGIFRRQYEQQFGENLKQFITYYKELHPAQ